MIYVVDVKGSTFGTSGAAFIALPGKGSLFKPIRSVSAQSLRSRTETELPARTGETKPRTSIRRSTMIHWQILKLVSSYFRKKTPGDEKPAQIHLPEATAISHIKDSMEGTTTTGNLLFRIHRSRSEDFDSCINTLLCETLLCEISK